MPKFLLLGGKFTDADGKSYNAGDGAGARPARRVVVNSTLELDKLFRNKFERLNGTTKHGPEGESGDGDVMTDDPPQAVRTKLEKGKTKGEAGYKPDRNVRMDVEARAEIMDEETDADGATEEAKVVRQKAKAKAAKAAEEPEDEDDDAEEPEKDADEDEDAEAVEPAEDDEEVKPARAPKLRGMGKRKRK